MPRIARKRRSSSSERSSSNEDILSDLLRDIKDTQKSRKRPAGMNIADLIPTTSANNDSAGLSKKDPFKLKYGGIVDMKKMKHADLKDADIEHDMRQTFSKESHLRDEDEEMRKYVEEELSKKKGRKVDRGTDDASVKDKAAAYSVQDEAFAQLPDHLKRFRSKKNEEMLSNQMLCGIPEVDLGVEAKIRNIEETETAKLRLLKEAVERKKDFMVKLTAKQNLAKDLAKSYLQHNKYKIEETTLIGSESMRAKPTRPRTGLIAVVDDDTPKLLEDGRTVERTRKKT